MRQTDKFDNRIVPEIIPETNNILYMKNTNHLVKIAEIDRIP